MASISVAGDSSGSITIAAPAVAGSGTLTLPVATDTLVGKATTDTLTNKSIAATQLTGVVAVANGGTGLTASKQLLQNLNFTTGAVATGTGTFPDNNTIPQITGGTQFMQLAITPTSATSKLEVTVTIVLSPGSPAAIVAAPFYGRSSKLSSVFLQCRNRRVVKDCHIFIRYDGGEQLQR